MINDQAPAATPAEPAPTSANPHSKAGLSASEAATLAQWAKEDLANGKITADQAEKIFTDLNTPLEQRLPDTRSAEERQIDAAFPPAKESDYTIRYGRPGEDVKETPELKTFDANARGWLASAGMPREIGNSLVSAIGKTLEVTKGMSADRLEAYGHKEFEKLQRVHGEKLEERLRDAAVMIDQLEQRQPGLKNLLKRNGIGDNALVANMLIQHAAVYHARTGR